MNPPPTCHLLAPAYAHLEPEARTAMRERAEHIAQAMGWKLHWHPSSEGSTPAGHWCSQEQRETELRHAVQGDVLWPIRGGYGCTHLLPMLQARRLRRAPVLIGFSDITYFHALWQRRAWGTSLYAMMPAISSAERASASLLALLRQGTSHWDQQQVSGVSAAVSGQAQGPCFAACLSILAHCVGTPCMPDLRDHILFLEDIDEAPYAIDRKLWQLWHGGHLRQLRGIIWGRFPGCQHHHGPSIDTTIGQWNQRLAIPSLVGLPFGHDPDPIAIPCGGWAEISAGADRWSLKFSAKNLYKSSPYQSPDSVSNG